MAGKPSIGRPGGEEPSSTLRCAIYTRKSTEEGLQQEFNTLDAQREAAEAYIRSQLHAGWTALAERYDDGGFTGANLERPALRRLLADIEAGKIDCVLVYKVDRLSRSLLDFARLMEVFERRKVSLVSITQPLNTTGSMGRLTLNILLSFAEFERQMIADRTRDKMAAARRKGKWVGGRPVLGYDIAKAGGKLVGEYGRGPSRAPTGKRRPGRAHEHLGRSFTKPILVRLLRNLVYLGKVSHQNEIYAGEQEAIVEQEIWERAQEALNGEQTARAKAASNRTSPLRRFGRGHQALVPQAGPAVAPRREYIGRGGRPLQGDQRGLPGAVRSTAPAGVRHVRPRRGRRRGRGADPFGGFNAGAGGFQGFGDLFDAFFGGAAGGVGRRPRVPTGADLRYDLQITFAEAISGADKEIEFTSLARCDTCVGTGAEPGTSPIDLPQVPGHRRAAQRALDDARPDRQRRPVRSLSGHGQDRRDAVPHVPRRRPRRAQAHAARDASRPASTTATRSGCRARARPGRAAACRATCTWSSTSRRIRSCAAATRSCTTSCRSRSRRRRSERD